MTQAKIFKPADKEPRFELSLRRKGHNDPLADFPRSEHWRLVTDGCQHHLGITNFSPVFYQGMKAGYEVMVDFMNHKVSLSPELIQTIHMEAFGPVIKPKKAGFKEGNSYFQIAPLPLQDSGISPNQAGLNDFVKAALSAWKQNRWALITVDKSYQEARDRAVGDKKASVEAERKMTKFIFENLDDILLPDDEEEMKKKITECLQEQSQNVLCIFGDATTTTKAILTLKKDIETLELKLAPKVKEVKKAKKDEDEIIAAVVEFVQKCHQNHWFGDGNGRTFILILLNAMLIKYLDFMSFIRFPSHFTGFAVDDLVRELRDGQAEFNKYKIKNAREFIEAHVKKQADIKDEKDGSSFYNQLLAKFSNENPIALAQINEVFLRIKENRIKVDKDRDKILNALKDMYCNKLESFLNIECDPNIPGFSKEAVYKMLEYQEIFDFIRRENPQIHQNLMARIEEVYPEPEAEPPTP